MVYIVNNYKQISWIIFNWENQLWYEYAFCCFVASRDRYWNWV